MQLMRHIFDFYIFSNIHVALATFCLAKITLLTFENKNNEIPIFIFFATIVAYNFIRVYRKSNIKTWFSDWIDSNKKGILFISIGSFIGICYVAFGLSYKALLSLIPFGLCTLFYVVPLKWITEKETSLRTLSGFKIFLIAFCWAGVTVLFPLLNYDIEFSIDVWVVFLQRFLFVLVITIPFDIRDLGHDEDILKTIPQVLGLEKAKRLGLFLLMLFLGLTFLRSPINQNQIRIELIVVLISLLFLMKSKPNQNKYYSAFFVESIPIVWLLLVF